MRQLRIPPQDDRNVFEGGNDHTDSNAIPQRQEFNQPSQETFIRDGILFSHLPARNAEVFVFCLRRALVSQAKISNRSRL
jgi:hypothetical protein